MPQIRPLSDLQDKLNDIYEVIHQTDQPMFFTREGQNDLVIMSFDTYNRNFNNNHFPTTTQSYVKTIVEEQPTEQEQEEPGQTSEDILREARKNLQNMVDEYSNDCDITYRKNKRSKRRRQ